ncbi:MAG: hypothetical protein GY749_17510 [Desulfobacteraceae bacterium]|nr:hypothetical protein [Desulfobacteraceae bacterium]
MADTIPAPQETFPINDNRIISIPIRIDEVINSLNGEISRTINDIADIIAVPKETFPINDNNKRIISIPIRIIVISPSDTPNTIIHDIIADILENVINIAANTHVSANRILFIKSL